MRNGICRALSLIAFLLPSIPSPAATAPVETCNLPSEIRASVKLDGQCVYKGAVKIVAPNVVLDCNGATIDARTENVGIKVVGYGLQHIEIRNCHIDGAMKRGILVGRPWDPADAGRTREQLYKVSPKDISIHDSSVTNSGSVGIYIGDYVVAAHLENVKVSESEGVAVYLDNSTQRGVIENSVFQHNGFRKIAGSADRKPFREAIAIDSSAHNLVINNRFVANGKGGVFLYKNCMEKHTKPGAMVRWQHSSYNKIANNTFQSERTGVWIASRQAKDLSTWGCGDPELAPGYYRDYADHNTVQGNLFSGGGVGVDVQDDFSAVLNNTFTGQDRACVRLGTRKRDALLGEPVRGTVLENNTCNPLDRQSIGYVVNGDSSFSMCQKNKLQGEAFGCGIQQ